MSKKLITAVVMSALVLSLAACTSTSSAVTCKAQSGPETDKVTVSGATTHPSAKFPKKLAAKVTERKELKAGKGDAAKSGATVAADYVVYNATTGKKLLSTTTKVGDAFALDTTLLPGLTKALVCSTAGSRVVAIVPPKDAFKSTGNTQLGVGPKDSMIFVFDILKVTEPTPTPTPKPSVTPLPRANGVPQPAEPGFPTVVLDATGAPTVTIPKIAAPTQLEIEVLKKGSGATVGSGDSVTVNYAGLIWATNVVFDSSWTRGAPASFKTDGVITGFGKALVGQKVGSQVVAVIPPADGYGASGEPQAGIKGTDTLVFVVDILATQK